MVTGVSHVSKLTHQRLEVTTNQAPVKERSLYIVGGVSGEDRSLKINNPDIRTLASALLERMYYCKVGNEFKEPPLVADCTITNKLGFFSKKVIKIVGRTTRISPEQFAEMFTGRKRTLYTNSLEDYYLNGVQRRHSRSVAFVKCEKVPPNKAARCIQPRNRTYNIGVGTFIKPIEHRIYGAIGKIFGEKVVVVKGFNVSDQAKILHDKWSKFAEPVALGLDATKFDMHVSAAMLRWEHSVYLGIYNNHPELAKLLTWQINNIGAGYCDDGKLKYSVAGRRFSGDMNTALGNCLIMCAMIYAYSKERGVKISLANNGDDCQVFMEKRDLAKFSQGLDAWFLELGFRMTVEPPVYEFAGVEFCQMRPIQTINGFVMVRNINKAREKDSMSIIPLSNTRAAMQWLYAVGECGLASCSGVPIMQSFYECYMRHGIQSRMSYSVALESGARINSRGMDSKWSPVSAQARLDCFVAWGYTPDEQLALENYYDGLRLDLSVPRAVDNLLVIPPSPL